MSSLLLKIIIFTNFQLAISVILHKKGPTHRRLAESCLEEIIREHFHYHFGKSDVNHTMLLTVMITSHMTSPAFEIQENILKRIHDMAKWYQIEILSYGKRFEFESFAECLQDECQKSFIIDFKTNFYVIIVDSRDNFDTMLDVLEESSTFNPKAIYLVYIEYVGSNYKDVARDILMKMWMKLLIRTAVLIPKTLQVFSFFRLNTATKGPYECESNITLSQIDQCVDGKMLNIKKHYYGVTESRNHLNCSVGVIAMRVRPFVITRHRGFEIEVLQNIAKIINVHLNITMCENITDTWGTQENGTWTDKLKLIYENYYIGVGNVETGMDYATDFAFSRFYHMEPLVFVVPIARFVPKWRVLTAIFTVEMWGICLGIIVFFAISFFLASKFGSEVKNFRNLGECFFQSFQIIIYHPVPVQPVTGLTRVFFLSLALISIMMASAYTCSLVYYLKNPIREHQSCETSDIMDGFGNYKYGIGGVSRFRELFTFSSEEEGTELFEIYQTSSGENNTMLYWLRKVAEDRNIWTIASKLYVNYLLSNGSNPTTDEKGKPKVYVFKKQLMSYSISLIVRKGHSLLPNIDYAIQRLTWGGLIARMTSKYTKAIQRRKFMIDDENDDVYTPLTVGHLEGAFALLALGSTLGFVTLIIECFVKNKSRRSRKIGINHTKRVRRSRRRNNN